MRFEAFQSHGHGKGGLSEVLLAIIGVFAALLALSVAIDVDVLVALFCLSPSYPPARLP
ncbi:MAG: hypothetical protein ACKVQU_13185 [Burkholderiales bacterium]